MRSPLMAVFWNQWLRTRWEVLSLAGASLGINLVLFVATWIWSTRMGMARLASFDLLLNGYLLTGFAAAMLFSRRNSLEVVDASPGSYLLTMPVSTVRITAACLLYTVIVVGTIATVVAALSKGLLGDYVMLRSRPTPFPHWQYPFLCICEALLLQSILLLTGVKNEVIVLFGSFVLLILMAAGVVLLVFGKLGAYNMPLWLAFSAAACWASHTGIKHFRCQRRESLLPILIDKCSMGLGRTRAFRNAGRALAWYGWRRYGRLFCAIAVTILVVMAGGALLRSLFGWGRGPLSASHIVDGAYAAILFASLFSAVCMVLLDVQEMSTGRNHFLFILPVRTLRFGWGVLLPVAATQALVIAIVTVVLSIGLCLTASPETWNEILSLKTTGFVCGSIACSWVVLWLSVPLFYIAVFTAGVTAILYYTLLRAVEPHAVVYGVLSVMLILLTAAALVFAWKKAYFARKNLICMTVAWLVGVCAAGILAPFLRMTFSADEMTSVNYTTLFLATVLLPMPFIAVPALIDILRHR